MEKDNDKNSALVKGKELMLFVSLLNDLTTVIWDKNDTSSTGKFYYTIFMKLQFILDGIHVQVYNLDNKPHYGLSASLSLRTCMLDILNLYYVMDVNQHDEIAEYRINQIMADHVRYTLPELKVEERAQLVRDWPALFDENGSLLKFGNFKVRELVSGISNFKTLVEEAGEANHYYKLLSKYEHNGAFTFNLLHNPYSAKGNQIVKHIIYSSIAVSARACKVISSNWLDDDDPLAVLLDDAITNLHDFSK